jgi:glycosyltransferase involved in cell wall biosynthesis
VPDTDLSAGQAKARLGVDSGDRTILFFGRIGPYKGLEFLIDAFHLLVAKSSRYRLLVAGEPKEGVPAYIDEIRRALDHEAIRSRVIARIEYIPNEETEVYFKAGDMLALPYTQVFQSGVMFLAYGFGLPVVATDVGSFADDVAEGRTGWLCRRADAADLARAIEAYFDSDLFRTLGSRRQDVRDYADERHSWETVGDITRHVYDGLLMTRATTM